MPINYHMLADFRVAVDIREFDPRTKLLERVTDEKKVLELARKISPITHVSADDPPTLIIHGDADKLVPIQQAELFIDKLKSAGVEAKLVVNFWLRPGNSSCANNVIAFTLDLLANLPRHIWLRLVRADSGFCSAEWLDLLEAKNLRYIVVAKLLRPCRNGRRHSGWY